MRVFIDTNIILDVAIERQPFFVDSRRVRHWSLRNAMTTSVAWHTLTNAYYILRKHRDDATARTTLRDLLRWIEIAPTQTNLAIAALDTPGRDLEDTLQALCAHAAAADIIVTRNAQDFRDSPVRAVTPADFLARFA